MRSVESASGWAQVSTLIGYGSPNKAGSHDVHGAALGAKETEATREKLQWKYGEFEIPEQAYKLFGRAKEAGSKAEKAWEQSLADYGKKYPEVSSRPLSQPACFSSHCIRDVPSCISHLAGVLTCDSSLEYAMIACSGSLSA